VLALAMSTPGETVASQAPAGRVIQLNHRISLADLLGA
jgi:hypothetical protein